MPLPREFEEIAQSLSVGMINLLVEEYRELARQGHRITLRGFNKIISRAFVLAKRDLGG